MSPSGLTALLLGLTAYPLVQVSGDKLNIYHQRHQFVWTGHVKTLRGPVKIDCDQLTATYAGNMEKVTRTVCDGHVEVHEVINGGERWGKGDHADFDNVSGVLVVTGAPEAHQAESVFTGSRITYYVGTSDTDVENPVATVLSAGQEKPEDGGGRKSRAPKSSPPPPVPVHIQAAHLHGDDARHELIWVGHVRATREGVKLACDRMTAHYTGNQQGITRTVCHGHVEVHEQVDGVERWGKGDHADYNNVKGVLVVTGSPEAHEGKSVFNGTKVTYYVGTTQMEVQHPVAVMYNDDKEKPLLPKPKKSPPQGKAP